jgi:hypothetical protein
MKRILLWLKSFFNKKEIVGYSNVDIILELAEEHGSLIPHGFDADDGQLVYSKDKMVEITAVVGDMSAEDAWEYLEYNTFCAYVGEKTPLYITTY